MYRGGRVHFRGVNDIWVLVLSPHSKKALQKGFCMFPVAYMGFIQMLRFLPQSKRMHLTLNVILN